MKRILVVEPNRDLAAAITRYIRQTVAGLETYSAHDSQQAIHQADEARPDCVILELAMAEHNGLAFLQEFRSYADWTDIPVIVYSQISAEQIGLSSLAWQKHGVVEYLYKPTVSLAQLQRAINEVLNLEVAPVTT